MPTITITSKLRVAGEADFTAVRQVPANIAAVRIDMVIAEADILDPAVACEVRVEWSVDGSTGWRHLASVSLVGKAANSLTPPFVQLEASTMQQLVGRFVRGVLVAQTPMTLGAQLTF